MDGTSSGMHYFSVTQVDDKMPFIIDNGSIVKIFGIQHHRVRLHRLLRQSCQLDTR